MKESTYSCALEMSAHSNHHQEYFDDLEHEINLASNNLKNTQFLTKEVRNIKDFQPKGISSRTTKWLTFFNKNHDYCRFYFEATICALFAAAQKNEIWRTQTTEELNLSFNFYETIFSNAPNLFLNEKSESATILMQISLIFSKYSGMVVKSIREEAKKLNKYILEPELINFFKCIFIKYEDPYVLTNKFYLLKMEEINILMHILQGNNIKSHPQLPIKISNKELFILVNKLPQPLYFKNNILVRSIVAAKLFLQGRNSRVLPAFLVYSKVFNHHLDEFVSALDFWVTAFYLLAKDEQFNNAQIIDYLEYKKHMCGESYSLKGRTYNSILRETLLWHDTQEFTRKEEVMKLNWQPRYEISNTIIEDGVEYKFNEITNGEEMLFETKHLHHCVFSYTESCHRGFCSIFSMQKSKNGEWKPSITIEVQQNSIVQIAGKNNRSASAMEINVIKRWASQMKIEYIEQNLQFL